MLAVLKFQKVNLSLMRVKIIFFLERRPKDILPQRNCRLDDGFH